MKKPLYKVIYESIAYKINRGELRKGDQIPSEKELAEQFNVSRITSKKALDILSQEKLIERIQGKGSFVAKMDPETLPKTVEKLNMESKEVLTVGLIISGFSDSYGSTLVKQIEKEVTKQAGVLFLRITQENLKEEEKAIEELIHIGVSGIIILPVHGEHYNMKILELVLKGFPILLLDRYLRGIQASSVSTDNIRASKMATNYLFSLGHKDIAYISPPGDGTSVLAERLVGYQQAFNQQPFHYHPEYVLTSIVSDFPAYMKRDEQFEKELNKVKDFLIKHPALTGFVVCRYSLAKILEYVIHSLGKKIPQDYSIVCFDSPKPVIGPSPFTHIAQNEEEIARKAVDLLLEQINGKRRIHREVIDFELVEGLSTRKIE
ncbi:GntR family transcriptional regulator [Lederbergia sp. NSJ-179]|uniref:GntR family transcriptional regulator n=1 Tax=Lederbergia sp. NSJ-179 TaxID=2931402 RepID=UPI001FD077C4|nr:GntR family transcriptional regulator [Lederbergia sp. NSJ-179]MCJ7840626.1 GntR family transcriptional regulator [Lederbergia sp. NSJ-179]